MQALELYNLTFQRSRSARVPSTMNWPLYTRIKIYDLGAEAISAVSVQRLETLERLVGEFDARANTPLSLLELSRIAIRAALVGPHFKTRVGELRVRSPPGAPERLWPLPPLIRNYIVEAYEAAS